MPLDGTETAADETVSAARSSAPRDTHDDDHGDIVYPSAIPFVLAGWEAPLSRTFSRLRTASSGPLVRSRRGAPSSRGRSRPASDTSL